MNIVIVNMKTQEQITTLSGVEFVPREGDYVALAQTFQIGTNEWDNRNIYGKVVRVTLVVKQIRGYFNPPEHEVIVQVQPE